MNTIINVILLSQGSKPLGEISAEISGIILYFLICGLIAYYVGIKRQIGFWWSLIFNITASPIFGTIITLLSKKTFEEPPKKSKTKIIIGWILCIISGVLFLANIEIVFQSIFRVFAIVAYFSFGIYLIGIGKGKVYNRKLPSEKPFSQSLDSLILPDSHNKKLKHSFNLRKINLQSKIYVFVYSGTSLLIGFLLGWWYKLPNKELLNLLYNQESEWKKNIALEIARKSEPFFSTQYFSFNWIVFIAVAFVSFGILYFSDYFHLWRHIKVLIANKK